MSRIDETLLKEVTERLIVALDPEQVILFGSQAWGTPEAKIMGDGPEKRIPVKQSRFSELKQPFCSSGLQFGY